MRIAAGIALLLAICARPALGQRMEPRSNTYLFTAEAADARAVWINPAGLAVRPEASIYAEAVADHGNGTDWGVRQFGFGVHSRAIAAAYQRDRFLTGGSSGTWRVGAGFPLAPRMALGLGITFSHPQRTYDAGLRFSPVRMLDAGFVVRNLGRPNVDSVERPIVLQGGIVWHLAQGRLGLKADGYATERHPNPGYDRMYRAGAHLIIPGRLPFIILTAVDLERGLSVARWSMGLSIGFDAQAIAVGSALPDGGASARLQSFSVTGLARGTPRRR